jgi:hypothetical protein
MILNKELGLMLYWEEGDKTGNYFVALTNSDVNILIYFVRWLRRYFDIKESKLRGRLYIWEDSDEVVAREYWSSALGIPVEQFTKSYISKSVPKIRKNGHNYGICRVSYGSTKIFSEIMKGIRECFIDGRRQ